MKTTAAILVETARPLELVELEVPALKPGQVLVEIQFSGVCHTQLSECRGLRGPDAFLPHCMGHEGSGTVMEIGAGVTKVKPKDAVILSWIKGAGLDVPGTVYKWGERAVNAGGVTTFSRHAVVSENRVTKILPAIAPEIAAMLGCAVPTGLGAVFNSAAARPGQSAAVFGCGGIGLCAVAGARIAGCSMIVAVDCLPQKLELAQEMGATHVINVANQDVAAEIQKLSPGGVDIAIEASGKVTVMAQALGCVRAQGGVAVVVGNARAGELVSLDPKQFNMGKQLRGTWGGDNLPERDFPRYLSLVRSGKLRLDALIAKRYGLSDINLALDELEQGVVARPLIDMACVAPAFAKATAGKPQIDP